MDKISIKCFFFTALFLISGISYEISAGRGQAGTSSSGEILPIILMHMKKSNVLKLPNDVSKSSWLSSFRKTMDFQTEKDSYEKYFCAADSKNKERLQTAKEVLTEKPVNDLIENCLFEKSTLGLKNNETSCEIEPKSFISRIYSYESNELNSPSITWSTCGTGANQMLYRYEYQLWLESELLNSETQLTPPLTKSIVYPEINIVDFEIYRFCYDITTQELLYTKHSLLSPKLLFNENFKEATKSYDYENSNFGNEELLDFAKYKKIYDEVNDPNTENSSLIGEDAETPKLMDYKLEKLVPDGDFAISLWTKPAYHIVNQHLMHKDIIKPWNHITNLIQNQLKDIGAEGIVNIYTGTFDIFNKHEATSEIKIREFWVKLVHIHYRNSEPTDTGTVIIANNHINRDMERTINAYCDYQHMYQYTSDEEDSDRSNSYWYIRSCDVTSDFEQLFGLDLKITGRFELSRYKHFTKTINPDDKSKRRAFRHLQKKLKTDQAS